MLPPSWETRGTMLQVMPVSIEDASVEVLGLSQPCNYVVPVADMCKIGFPADRKLIIHKMLPRGRPAANAAALKMPEVKPRRIFHNLL